MSLPETLDWCEEHEMPRCRHAAWVGEHCVGQHPLDGPDVGTCRMVELRVAGPDDLVIRREGMVKRALAAYRNPHTQMVKRRAATPEDRMEAALLAAAEGGEE